MDQIAHSKQLLMQTCNFLKISTSLDAARRLLLDMDHNQTATLDAIGSQIGLNFDAFLREEKPYLSSVQIQEMIQKGFTIGAHSQSHPRYDHMTLEAQIEETSLSIERLKKDFEIPYTAFAFPFSDFDISDIFYKIICDKYPDIQLFGIKEVRSHKRNYYNRYIMELHTQKSPALALKYLYLKSLIKK